MPMHEGIWRLARHTNEPQTSCQRNVQSDLTPAPAILPAYPVGGKDLVAKFHLLRGECAQAFKFQGIDIFNDVNITSSERLLVSGFAIDRFGSPARHVSAAASILTRKKIYS
jgi:hypothetical protein